MNSLSIVFQGPVLQGAKVCMQVVNNIRRTRDAFPEAEIIVSSWHCAPCTELYFRNLMAAMNVEVVLSHDPGPLVHYDRSGQWISNLNRLQVSTAAGLDYATRPLSLKLRTDTFLSGRGIVPLLQRHVLGSEGPIRETQYTVFTRRVINASWFARDARGSLPFLFHPGDILLAGLTEDVRLFFSAPLADDTLFLPSEMLGLRSAWRLVPEQWFWLHAIKSVTGIMEYEGNFASTASNIERSERYYLANFVPYGAGELNLCWKKYWRCYPLRGLFSLYTHSRWLRLAEKYFGKREHHLTLPERLLTYVWRAGYILRTLLLRSAFISRFAKVLFVHRK
ncbi:WavE lipopolysaccharide synthesis family protein [Enterobacter cloacae]